MKNKNTESCAGNKNLMMFLLFLLGFIVGALTLWMTFQYGGLMRVEGKADLFYPSYFRLFIPTPPGGIYYIPTYIPTPPGG